MVYLIYKSEAYGELETIKLPTINYEQIYEEDLAAKKRLEASRSTGPTSDSSSDGGASVN